MGRGLDPETGGTVWPGDTEAEFTTPRSLILSGGQTSGQATNKPSGWHQSLDFLLLKQTPADALAARGACLLSPFMMILSLHPDPPMRRL